MRNRAGSVAAVLFAVPLAMHPAAAQTQAVPAELVRALLATPSAAAGAPEIVVGRVPDGFPAELVPAGARVIGGVRRDSTSLVAALAVPQRPAEAGEALQQALVSAGWTGPETRQARGFVGPGNQNPWRFLCHDHQQVSINSAPAPDGGSYLRVDYSREEGTTRCTMMAAAARNRAPWDDAPIPTLTMPPGATVISNGFGNPGPFGTSGASTSARVRSALSAAELLARFAAQLRQAEWTASEPGGPAGVAAQTFRRRTPDGKEWFGVLTAVAVPGSDLLQVSFEVQELEAAAH